MEQWSVIQNQLLLKTIFELPPIISYKKWVKKKRSLGLLKATMGVRAGLLLQLPFHRVNVPAVTEVM